MAIHDHDIAMYGHNMAILWRYITIYNHNITVYDNNMAILWTLIHHAMGTESGPKYVWRFPSNPFIIHGCSVDNPRIFLGNPGEMLRRLWNNQEDRSLPKRTTSPSSLNMKIFCGTVWKISGCFNAFAKFSLMLSAFETPRRRFETDHVKAGYT